MKKIILEKVDHDIKVGQTCGSYKPNITENSIFIEDGKPIGFFLKDLPENLIQFIEISNKEFNSDNVPKSVMSRINGVQQMSTIIGAIPPNPRMRRNYPSISSVHTKKSANIFIKAMLKVCEGAENIIKDIMPEQFELQKKIIQENVPEKFRFGRLFTSSISNYNIAADFHIDTRNLKNTVNAIITKKYKAIGGDLRVPDYDATMDSANNSLLVYPAWKNIHGVTPIITNSKNGYRNSLIFYPLSSFRKYMNT